MAFTRLARIAEEQQQGVSDAIVISEIRASAAAQIASLARCWILDVDQYGGNARRAVEVRHGELITAQHILATLHQLARRLAMLSHAHRKHECKYRRLVDELELARQVASSASVGLLRSVITAAIAADGATPPRPRAPETPPAMLALIRSEGDATPSVTPLA